MLVLGLEYSFIDVIINSISLLNYHQKCHNYVGRNGDSSEFGICFIILFHPPRLLGDTELSFEAGPPPLLDIIIIHKTFLE